MTRRKRRPIRPYRERADGSEYILAVMVWATVATIVGAFIGALI